jgi:hypothetical protein
VSLSDAFSATRCEGCALIACLEAASAHSVPLLYGMLKLFVLTCEIFFFGLKNTCSIEIDPAILQVDAFIYYDDSQKFDTLRQKGMIVSLAVAAVSKLAFALQRYCVETHHGNIFLDMPVTLC